MDRFSTHLSLLTKIFKIVPVKTALEFGTGNYSTRFLLDNTVEAVTSIEMQSQHWFDTVSQKFGSNPKWKGILSLGPSAVFDLQYEPSYDFILVDGHGSSRPECVNFSAKLSDIIVAHDTEAISVYGWGRVNLPELGYFSFTDRRQEPWTTVWTKNEKLIKKLNEN